MSIRARNQGELEGLILNILWSAKLTESPKLTSHQILENLPTGSELALTTVLTVLSRLVDKDLVNREAGTGRAFLFEATQTQAQHNASLMLGILSNTQNPGIAFSHFASQLSPEQLAQLRQSLG